MISAAAVALLTAVIASVFKRLRRVDIESGWFMTKETTVSLV
jgi:hypothetical protein